MKIKKNEVVIFVHSDGKLDTYGYAALIDRSLVRPAIWVKAD